MLESGTSRETPGLNGIGWFEIGTDGPAAAERFYGDRAGAHSHKPRHFARNQQTSVIVHDDGSRVIGATRGRRLAGLGSAAA